MAETAAPRPLAVVVEDDVQIAQLVKFIVEREGFDVSLAHDGRAAQQLIAAGPAPALAILDFMLPHVDGLQLLAEMRARPQWQACGVIMLTAKAQERDVARALEAGADAHLGKPFLPDDLRECMRRVMADRGAR